MNAIGLNRAGNADQVLVNHGNQGYVVLLGQVTEDQLELLDVVMAVVGWKGDASQQDFDVGVFKSRQHRIEVVASLAEWLTAEAVVAAEFDDDDVRMQEQDGAQAGDGVFGGGAAGALVAHFVVVAAGVQVSLQSIGERLAGLEAITSGNAVAIAGHDGPVGGQQRGGQ